MNTDQIISDILGAIKKFGFGDEKDLKISNSSYWETTKQGHSTAQRIMGNKLVEKEIVGAKKTVTFSNDDEEIPRYNMMSVKKQKVTL